MRTSLKIAVALGYLLGALRSWPLAILQALVGNLAALLYLAAVALGAVAAFPWLVLRHYLSHRRILRTLHRAAPRFWA